MSWLDALKRDAVPLLVRLTFGGLLLGAHGLPKLLEFADRSVSFADPLGVGPLVSLCLVIFAEVLCAAGLMLGVLTRLTAIPPLVTMLVAIFLVHRADPWPKSELAMLYAASFTCLIITGAGRLSIDGLMAARRRRRAALA